MESNLVRMIELEVARENIGLLLDSIRSVCDLKRCVIVVDGVIVDLAKLAVRDEAAARSGEAAAIEKLTTTTAQQPPQVERIDLGTINAPVDAPPKRTGMKQCSQCEKHFKLLIVNGKHAGKCFGCSGQIGKKKVTAA